MSIQTFPLNSDLLNFCGDFYNLFLFYFLSVLYTLFLKQNSTWDIKLFRFLDEISIDMYSYFAVALFSTKQIEALTAILINNNFQFKIFRVGIVAGDCYLVHRKISFQRYN